MNGDRSEIIMSIKPHWCQLIANGEKTVEIRKTKPNLNPGFKAYVYATKAAHTLIHVMGDGDENYGEIYHGPKVFLTTHKGSLGSMWGREKKVVGEFTCTGIEPLIYVNDKDYHLPNGECCLTLKELRKYGQGKQLYGWKIQDFKFYREPKELSDFGLTRPPQSWQYI